MATIGLDSLYYAKITEAANGEETYATPQVLAKAIKADLSVELAEAILYADDSAAEAVKAFKSGKLSLGINDIGVTKAQDLTGASVDDNGVLVSATEDLGSPVAVGFRALKSNGKYRYFWLYKVQFGVPATNLQTKGDSISFQTPTIEGTIMRRNKADSNGRHPWKAEVTDGESAASATSVSSWFESVYEPSFTENAKLSALTIGSISLSPTFDADTTTYTASTANATNVITATAADANATVSITVGETAVNSGSAATWETGSNTVTITVTSGTATKTYTVTVTKS